MEGSVLDSGSGAPPESWEVADLDASMRRLMLASSKKDSTKSSSLSSNTGSIGDRNQSQNGVASVSESSALVKSSGVAVEDLINSVDQFLLEALQNPRERLSVLRMELEIEKFINDPTRQQMEFQQLPTSYLRLAAHRVAQHYCLPSMVLLDNNLPDGSGSRIIVQKSAECKIPLIRLADIPVSLPSEDGSVVKVAIKQRPQKGSQAGGSSNPNLSRTNSLKSVEERKEEYNRARARIFNSNSFNAGTSGKAECEYKAPENFQHTPRISKVEERPSSGGPESNMARSGLIDSVTGMSRSARSRTDKGVADRSKTNAKVAILRDRETDRKDPDYDRSYDRYMQRFDPGFGYSGGAYGIQPMYAPALNYNIEFPQLGSAHISQISNDHFPRSVPQHLAAPWSPPSGPAGISYVPQETMLAPYSHSHVGGRANTAMFLPSVQYHAQHPGLPIIFPHEQVHHSFIQSHQQQTEATFGLARPR